MLEFFGLVALAAVLLLGPSLVVGAAHSLIDVVMGVLSRGGAPRRW